MNLWLYLDFPQLQLETLYHESTVPTVIVHGRKAQIIQANQLAQQEGIKPGMGLGAAAALCHQLQVKPYDEALEEAQLTSIAQWLYLVTADICLVKPHGVLLKVSDMLSLYPSLNAYWQTIVKHLANLSVNYRFASAYSPFAAKLLALNNYNKVVSEPEKITQALSQKSLQQTELKAKTIHTLNRVGIQTIGDLTQLSLPDLAKRFDIELVTYIGRLTGQLKHPIDFYHPPEHFKHYLELHFDISDVAWLEKPLLKIYQRLELFLSLRNKCAHQLKVTLHLRDAEAQIIKIAAAQGEYRAHRWLELSQLTLSSLALTAPVTAITVVAEQLSTSYFNKQDLFDGKQGTLTSNELVSILQAKLGNDQVSGITYGEDHRPELSNQTTSALSVNATKAPLQLSALRPSFLLSHPQPLVEKVSIIHGPERIVSGWWDERHITRDYFIAHSESGRWLWVYRTPTPQWFIHGLFS